MQCFDPTTNAWAIKAPFPGAARLQAASFSVGDLGYCGLGRNFNTDFSDWYCYRAADNQWTAIAPFPVACHESVAFNIHGDGYVGLGKSMDGTTYNHFYRYNALTNTWTPIAPYPGVVRTYSIAFGIGGRGYVFSGMDENGGFSSEFWVYHPATDTWEQLPDFPFEKKRGVANFVANNCAHVVAGLSHNFQRLDAHEMYCATVPESDETFHLYPNPNTGGFAIFNKGSETIQQLSIIDVSGKVLYHNTQASSHVYIHQLNLLSGCYLVRITLSDQSHIVKKVVVTD
jgi:N-acetylneuraminic acid mutarotase